jgi:hypothetical protein
VILSIVHKSRGIAFAWLGHPSTVVALALLVINDHLLKAASPGWVTGKLSDLAGLVLAPPLLAVLAVLVAPRLPARRAGRVAMVTVAVGFAAIKASPYGAELASSVWSLITPSLVRADPADLLTLPALAVCWWSLERARQAPLRLDPRGLRALRVAVLLPLALAGVAGTSDTSAGVARAERVAAVDGSIYLGTRYGGKGEFWVVSRDAGATWTTGGAPAADSSQPTACAGEVCYFVVPGSLEVQSRTGTGPWITSWGFSGRERWTLYRAYGELDDIDRQLSTTAVAVTGTAGGHLVVAANGRDGFVLRDPGGAWHRIGFPMLAQAGGDDWRLPTARDTPYQLPAGLVLPIDRWYAAILAGFLLLAALIVGCVQVAKRSGAAGKAWELAIPVILFGPPVLLLEVLGRAEPEQFWGWIGFVAALPLALLSLVTLVVALIRTLPRLTGRPRWLRLAAVTTAVTAAADGLIFLGWTRIGVDHLYPLVLADLAVFGLNVLVLTRAAARAEVLPWPPMLGPLWLTGRVS